ncbi:MAG: autoinducer binding domain-containing protein [Kiloniellales bacterium]
MMAAQLERQIARIDDGRSEGDVKVGLSEAARLYGLDGFFYFVVNPPKGYPRQPEITTYEPDWLSHYVERRFAYIDPVFVMAATTTLPFDWERVRGGGELTAEQRSLFEEAGEFKIRRGFTIPIHGPLQGLSTMSFSSDSPDADLGGILKNYMGALFDLSLHVHEAMLRIAQQSSASTAPSLSNRERECLSWAASGKTSWETGGILSISEETVVFHLKNAMRKLDVHSRQHAVVKAITLGLIVV